MLLHSAAVGSVAGAGEVLVSPAKPATAMEAAAAATMSRRTASRQAGCTVYEETRCRGSTRSQAQKEEGNLSVGTRLHLQRHTALFDGAADACMRAKALCHSQIGGLYLTRSRSATGAWLGV